MSAVTICEDQQAGDISMCLGENAIKWHVWEHDAAARYRLCAAVTFACCIPTRTNSRNILRSESFCEKLAIAYRGIKPSALALAEACPGKIHGTRLVSP